MDLLNYQRTVFAFHGCDRRVRDAVLLGKQKLLANLNTYDWFGTGIYFWEHGAGRALEWAIQHSKRKGTKIKEPAVLGAVIQLGNCFDLLDVEFTQKLASAARNLGDGLAAQGVSLPANQSAGTNDFDWLRRERDRYLLNYVIPEIKRREHLTYHSVRGVL
jgi:hypothetical protein